MGQEPAEELTVFELANDETREFYVGFGRGALADLLAVTAGRPPRELAHWRFDEHVNGRCVQERVKGSELPFFLKGYVGTLRRTGWKVIVAGEAASRPV